MIETVEDAQHELNVAIQETIADMGGDECEVDEGSMASDLFSSMAYDWPADVAAEVARREFGFVPHGAPPQVAEAFNKQHPDWEF